MKKRRRKSLSGTQAQHTDRQEVHLRSVNRTVADAYRALNKEDCTAAGKSLLQAASSWGAYNAEKDWSERSSAGENRRSNDYFKAREDYFDRCVIERGR